MSRREVVIVGGGPAGLTAARFSAERGADTLLLEARRDFTENLRCGEFIPSLEQMKELFPRADIDGILDEEMISPCISRRIREISVFSPRGREYSIDFDGIVLERRIFEKELAISASKAGAEILLGKRVREVIPERRVLKIGSEEISFEVLILADGPFSLARKLGFPTPSELTPTVQYEVPGKKDRVEMYLGNKIAPGGYAWVIPKSNSINIGLGVRWKKNMMMNFLEKFRERMCGNISPVYFTSWVVPSGGPIQRTCNDFCLVVGDAAGQVIPTNGGGIPTSLICGRIAGEIASRKIRGEKDLVEYEKEWRRQIGRELENSLRARVLIDRFMRSDLLMETLMAVFGSSGVEKVLECKPIGGA
ncbi:MAG TPA: NAD(P)/FAD-dependent oxidoreductase [Euryarchaeota archaeon]|nr:MAG: hypothetical protein DRN46_03270 [Thermococci archaeon]RLF97228.1 MAG: hypothetical protein DRN52_00700 [Thermococci archaeon]HDI10291.1 NAD(P)/FAD-dependent oxidoreductase [Euryarchaeota archaeon]